ncbi:MAG: hypothetical protein HKM93_23570 [Desulfobacteraceae bacterium]|nr:hypothetical protein [Desulfobacteraceae bacterium]
MYYEEEQIKLSSGEPQTKIDHFSSYLLGPTSEFDDVYVFEHKLDAFYFIKNFLDTHLVDPEKSRISEQIEVILKTRSDQDTADLKDIFNDNESMEVYAEGYWEAFILSSHPYWREWVELYKDDDLVMDEWESGDQESDAFDGSDEFESEQNGHSLLFSEPPDDVFNPEFVDEMLSIIPVAQ